jgi:hypothetical protein
MDLKEVANLKAELLEMQAGEISDTVTHNRKGVT